MTAAVQTRESSAVWLVAYRDLVERALAFASGTHTFEDIQEAVARKQMQAWPGVRSIVITQIVESPRNSELHFFLAAGDIDEILRLVDIICNWAKRVHQCTRATFVGRHGWKRHLGIRGAGWAPTHIVFAKDL